MDILQALQVIRELIEQTNGAGMFKKLNQLDMVRGAYDVVEKAAIDKSNLPDYKINGE